MGWGAVGRQKVIYDHLTRGPDLFFPRVLSHVNFMITYLNLGVSADFSY